MHIAMHFIDFYILSFILPSFILHCAESINQHAIQIYSFNQSTVSSVYIVCLMFTALQHMHLTHTHANIP